MDGEAGRSRVPNDLLMPSTPVSSPVAATVVSTEPTASTETLALAVPLSLISPAAAVKRFMTSFDALIEQTNVRMQSVEKDQLKTLYDENESASLRDRYNLSVVSSDMPSALQRDFDAPGRLGGRGGMPNAPVMELDALAATVRPRRHSISSVGVSERSEDASIMFPVLSIGTTMNWPPRNRPHAAREGQGDATNNGVPLNSPLPVDIPCGSPRNATSFETFDDTGATTPAPDSESTPALPGPFKETSFCGSHVSQKTPPDRTSYTRFLMFAQRLLHDSTISAQVRAQWVDELVTTSLSLFRMSEKLYESASLLGYVAGDGNLSDKDNHMASVLPVQDSPVLSGLEPARADLATKISLRQGSGAYSGGELRESGARVVSPLSELAGRSVSFVRNRRLTCPSYGEESTTSSFSANAVEVLNQYYIMRRLGVGTTATVSICMDHNTRKTYAVKSIPVSRKSNLHARLRKFSQTSDDDALMSMSEAPSRKSPEVPEVSRQEREIRVMRRLRHCPYVTRLHEVIDDEEEGMVHLIMSLAENGALTTVHPYDTQRQCVPCTPVRPLSRLARYGRQLLEALAGLQHQRIIHNDLKPDNILLTASDTVVLSDFGESVLMPPSLAMNPNASISAYFPGASTSAALLSRRGLPGDEASQFGPASGFDPNFLPDSSMFLSPGVGKDGKITGGGAAGTPAFSAPELVESNMCSYASDVWSFGVLLYAIVFGRLPFVGRSVADTYRAILEHPLEFPDRAELPADARLSQVDYEQWVSICRSILTRDPLRRPPVRTLLKLPVFANAVTPPMDPLTPPTSASASAASQKILNAALNGKDRARNGSAAVHRSPTAISSSPSKLVSTPQGGPPGFLAEVAGSPSPWAHGQLPVHALGSPSTMRVSTTCGILNTSSTTPRRSIPPRPAGSLSTAEAAPTFPGAPPPPPARPFGRGKSPPACEDRGGDPETSASAKPVHPTLLEYQKDTEERAEGEEPAATAGQTAAEPMSSPSLQLAPRTARMSDPRMSRAAVSTSGHPYTQGMEHGPIVSFLEDSHSLDGLLSTTGRRLLRSTATTVTYHDEDLPSSRVLSLSGGRSALCSRTVPSVLQPSHVGGVGDSRLSINIAAASSKTIEPVAMSQSLSQSEDAPPHPGKPGSTDDVHPLPVYHSPPTDSAGAGARSDCAVGNMSITSFRDPTSGSSVTNSSFAETLPASAHSERRRSDSVNRSRGSSLHRKPLSSAGRRASPGQSAVAAGAAGAAGGASDTTAIRNTSFYSLHLSSDTESAIHKTQQPTQARRRGRRRHAAGASLSDNDVADFVMTKDHAETTAPVASGNDEDRSSPMGDLIHTRNHARFAHLSQKESDYIRALNANLFPIQNAAYSLSAPIAVPMAEEPSQGADSLRVLPSTVNEVAPQVSIQGPENGVGNT